MVTSTSALPGTTILNLPIAIALDGTEYVPLVQGGVTARTQSRNITTLFSTPAGFLQSVTGYNAVYTSSAAINGSSLITVSSIAVSINAVTAFSSAVTVGSALNVAGTVTVSTGTATPAGGSSLARIQMGSTGIGVYFGSGAPTVTAAQGSLYLRSDGASSVSRMYVNSSGSSVWTAVITVA